MAKTQLGIGLIGCGRVAQAHLAAMEHLREDVELIAVADADPQKARETKQRWGASEFYVGYQDLLKHPDIHAVVVTLPNHLHHRAAVDAAEAEKHILIEKPLAVDTAQAYQMVQAARRAGVILMVGQSRRFADAVFALEKNLPAIGKLFRVQISFLVHFPAPPTDWWRRTSEAGGLVILLQGSHSIDSILTWIKKLPREVCAFSARRNLQWEGEDEADILLSFDEGELASVHLSLNTSPYLHEAILVGTKGSLRLTEYATGKPFGFRYNLDLNDERIFSGEQTPSNYTLQLQEFVGAIRENRVPRASGADVLKTMLVLDAARISEREKRIVSLEPPNFEAEPDDLSAKTPASPGGEAAKLV